MASIAGYKNNFNNLLYKTYQNTKINNNIKRAARTPLDLSYKGESPVDKIMNCGAAQINANITVLNTSLIMKNIHALTMVMTLDWTRLF